ncbi:MAG: hypothetical protein QM734_09875 [Cyclobacteriaceae bacterium]
MSFSRKDSKRNLQMYSKATIDYVNKAEKIAFTLSEFHSQKGTSIPLIQVQVTTSLGD